MKLKLGSCTLVYKAIPAAVFVARVNMGGRMVVTWHFMRGRWAWLGRSDNLLDQRRAASVLLSNVPETATHAAILSPFTRADQVSSWWEAASKVDGF